MPRGINFVDEDIARKQLERHSIEILRPFKEPLSLVLSTRSHPLRRRARPAAASHFHDLRAGREIGLAR